MAWKYKVRYTRRLDLWPDPVVWVCGMPNCRHKYRIFAWLHAALLFSSCSEEESWSYFKTAPFIRAQLSNRHRREIEPLH